MFIPFRLDRSIRLQFSAFIRVCWKNLAISDQTRHTIILCYTTDSTCSNSPTPNGPDGDLLAITTNRVIAPGNRARSFHRSRHARQHPRRARTGAARHDHDVCELPGRVGAAYPIYHFNHLLHLFQHHGLTFHPDPVTTPNPGRPSKFTRM